MSEENQELRVYSRTHLGGDGNPKSVLLNDEQEAYALSLGFKERRASRGAGSWERFRTTGTLWSVASATSRGQSLRQQWRRGHRVSTSLRPFV